MNPNLFNYSWGLPIQASTYAKKIDWAIYLVHGAMIMIFILWAIYMIFCLIRYRHRENVPARYSHPVGLKSYIPDVLILAFEIWLIFIVGIPIWAHIREEFPKSEDAVIVNLIAEQFAWNFHYPGPDGKFGKREISLISATNPIGLSEEDPNSKDDITMINELYLPLKKPVILNLSSKDVIHSFFVPEFRTKQDVVPGMKIPIWFEPTLTGKFEIACSQLCGLGHYKMRGDVIVQNEEEFEKWMEEKIKERQSHLDEQKN